MSKVKSQLGRRPGRVGKVRFLKAKLDKVRFKFLNFAIFFSADFGVEQ